ncbi:MAG: hypothetical protein J6M65_01755 [Eubacterium sp.]|nr:hypothetical protein [Eubacterium sp.]
MTEEEKRALQSLDFSDVKLEELFDISKIRIDSSKSVEERREQFLKQTGNPYMVRVGDTMVKISFSDNDTSFEEAFENLLAMS